MPAITLYGRLRELLLNQTVSSDRAQYNCIHMDELCTVFAESEGTRKVMIPTDVVLEWVSAYDMGKIRASMSAREMRDKVAPRSHWAPYQHGFETHLKAVIITWTKSKFS